MSERDVMTLLAAANPMRVDAVPQPNLAVDWILARGRRPSRAVVLVAVALLAAVGATLIGVLVFGAKPGVGRVDRSGPTTAIDGLGSLPTVGQPLPPTAKQVSLDDATAAIGRPIVLPDTSLVSPSDVGAVWVNGALPGMTAAVTFPSPGVFIQYTLPAPRDPTAVYRAIAQQDPTHFSTIDLNSRAALAGKQSPGDDNLGALIFVLNGVEIRIFGPFDESTLQAIAQSIIDRSQ